MQEGLDRFLTMIGFNVKTAYYYLLLGLDCTHEYTDREIGSAHRLSLLCRHPDKDALPVDSEQFSDLKDAAQSIRGRMKHMTSPDDDIIFRDKYRKLFFRRMLESFFI